MIPILLAAALAAAQSPAPTFADCARLVRSAPEKSIAGADAWRLKGGGLDAQYCLGLAYAANDRWSSSAAAFEQAARAAETARDPRIAELWTHSGNAWLAAGDGGKARAAFDAALAVPALSGELRGEVHLDRARAALAENNPAAARADIDRGLELVPADPFGWYLSAALARRDGNLSRAQKDIDKAVQLAPGEAAILLEAGNIAGLVGDVDAAKALYARAAKASPDSEAGRSARAALAANSGPEPAAAAAAPRS